MPILPLFEEQENYHTKDECGYFEDHFMLSGCCGEEPDAEVPIGDTYLGVCSKCGKSAQFQYQCEWTPQERDELNHADDDEIFRRLTADMFGTDPIDVKDSGTW